MTLHTDRERDRAEAAWTMLTTRSPGVDVMPAGFGSLKAADVARALNGLHRRKFLLGLAAIAGDMSVITELGRHIERFIRKRARERDWKTKQDDLFHRMAILALFEILGGKRCFACHGHGQYCPDLEDRKTLTRSELSDYVELQRLEVEELRKKLWGANITLKRFKRGLSETGASRKAREQLRALEDEVVTLEHAINAVGGRRQCDTCDGTGRLNLEGRHRAELVGLSADHWWRSWGDRYEGIAAELHWWIDDCLDHVKRNLRAQAA